MSSTELAERAASPPVALFSGATADDIANAAGEVAKRFKDIVKQQHLAKRIGDRDHVLIEGWQTIGTLTGVFAVEAAGVTELPWPATIEKPGQEPDRAGNEPQKGSPKWQEWKDADERRKRWEHRAALQEAAATGKAFGFTASFRAVKDSQDVGFGEGRCDRSERTWAGRDDYALAAMAQTRAQSRALGAPLRFLIKMAGYEASLPEDMSEPVAAGEAALPWGPIADDEQMEAAAQLAALVIPGMDGHAFVLAMGSRFDGVPQACVTMLRALARRDELLKQFPAQNTESPPEASGEATEAEAEVVA